jgi:broad specificity phosphatase PhoE
MPAMPRSAKILLIRHAEKPDSVKKGVSLSGVTAEKDLSIIGWQRAGALACLFAPPEGMALNNALATPNFIFASHSSSDRPLSTVLPLARKLNIEVNLEYGKGDESSLCEAAKACSGVVLISWQHDYMASIANGILNSNSIALQTWPKDRFDLIWIFDLDQTGRYQFKQLPQCLLPGDSREVL